MRRSSMPRSIALSVGLMLSTASGVTGRVQSPARAWLPLPALPVPVRAAAVTSDGERIFVLGGSTIDGRTAVVQILDLASRTWSYGPALPTPTDWGVAAYVASDLHFIGGVTSVAPATTQHLVLRASAEGWQDAAPLPSQVAGSAAVAIGSSIYLFAGNSGRPPNYTATTYVLDTSANSWMPGPPVPSPRINWSGARVQERAFLIGGGTGGLQTADDLLAFHPASNTWVSLPAIPMAREAHGVGAAQGLVCALGGRLAARGNFNRPFDDVSCYSTATETWTVGPRLPRPLQELAAASLESAIVAVGGADGEGRPVGDVWQLTIRQ